MKCVVDVVTACDREALDCGYCVDHHPHLGFCPDSLPEPSEAEGPRILEALHREKEAGR